MTDTSPDAPAPAVDDPVAAPPTSRRRRLHPRVRNLLEWVVVIGGALVVASLLRTFVFQTFLIPSASMEPALVPGDRVVVNKLTDEFHRGDMVVFRRPETWPGQHDMLIKRIVGLEGEVVEVFEDEVYVDGQPLLEPYLPEGTAMGDFGPVEVPEGFIFVMGDNREHSSDSRVHGPVEMDLVVGRAFVRIWPPDSLGRL